ncbi:sodium- and chloride-dependent glycine transporter 1-like [Asterias amurensis]|uniref:sodium- and chloride-dependent glycine transporter 1-like n=1 Tax=Asterias amurensis TaxID=7602 RepID=UPI003AB2C228
MYTSLPRIQEDGANVHHDSNLNSVTETTPAIAQNDKDLRRHDAGSADDAIPERETWGGRFEFILSVMGYSIGLGNVWRFPYLCYENGGGAFLIPYFIMIGLVALPIIFLELCLGQFSSLGCISVWKYSKLFKGAGFAMAFLSAGFCLYYNLVLAYCIYYMVISFFNPQPWVGCDHEWNTDNCYDGKSFGHLDFNDTANSSLYSTTETFTSTLLSTVANFTTAGNYTGKHVRATEEYWKLHVLDISDGLHSLGSIRWQLFLAFTAAWVIVYVCVSRGVKSSGKAVYFTATFPYVLLIVLLIRGVTLEGSLQGILFFIRPDFKSLGRAKVWQAAANQVFLSFSPGWGGMHTLASYNKFNNNCYRDAFMFCMSCAFTSIFSGFVMFSIVGFMAHDSNTSVEKVVDAGYGLAFVVFPEAVSRMWLPQLWSFLFFFMLIILGLDSQFVCLETLITALTDELAAIWPKTRRWKWLITLGTCCTMFVVGLPLVTQGGIYVMTLLDWYLSGFSPMVTTITETLVVSHIYGVNRISRDIHSMLNFTPSLYWRLCWMLFSPLVLLFIIVFAFFDYHSPVVGDYTFPSWADGVGWCLVSFSIFFIFTYGIYHLLGEKGTLIERLKMAIQPHAQWGPALNVNRLQAGYAPMPGHEQAGSGNESNMISAPGAGTEDYDFHHPKEFETGV